MPFKPENVIGEVLGKTAQRGYDPASDIYICPYTKATCIKTSQKKPYPVCSVWTGKKHVDQKALKSLMCVCPKRFYAINFLKDVVEHCWPGAPPGNPQIASEVQMKGFGNVDFVIADIQANGSIGQFLSVELQAIDITGSVRIAYEALLENRDLDKNPASGMNWKNVYKRYITQLISKGYFHHHWKSKIIAVIQDQFYEYVKKEADFIRIADVKDNPNVNIIFMTYALDDDPERLGQYKPVLRTVEGTSHSSLQNAILYKDPLSRDEFCNQINRSLARASISD